MEDLSFLILSLGLLFRASWLLLFLRLALNLATCVRCILLLSNMLALHEVHTFVFTVELVSHL